MYATKLKSEIRSINYNFDKHSGTLHMAPDNCCDMTGCDSLFEGIDPNARHVETFAGRFPDTVYVRSGDHWEACPPQK